MPTTEYGVDQFFQNAGTSPKMIYDVAGTLGWSPHNLVPQSQTFDAVYWSKTSVSVGANVIAAPNGATEADSVIPAIGGVNAYINTDVLTVTSGSTYTFSTYVKNGTLGNDWLLVGIASSVVWYAWFNLATGVKGTQNGSPVSYNIISVGAGWYRIDVTVIAGATTATIYLQARPADGSFGTITGNGASPAFYAWGAQLNLGTTPTAYLPTTTAARVGLALDYDPVTHAPRGLLCEPQATNLALQSAAFDNVSWYMATPISVTPNTGAAPDGATTADKIVATTTATINRYFQPDANITITGGATYTVSIYAKASEFTWLGIETNPFTTNQTYFDLVNGVVGTIHTSHASAAIAAAGSGWYRCSITFIPTLGAIGPTFHLHTANAQGATAGTAGQGLFLWGAQFELSSVATSHIPTLAATVTRAADQVSVTPASINYSATAGSWWVDVYINERIDATRIVSYDIATLFPIGCYGNAVQLYDVTSNLLANTVGVINGPHKAAAAFASADRAIVADGLTPMTDTAAGTALLSPGPSIQFGQSTNEYIRKLRYVPRRKSNAEIVTETT